jgi:hypothetical protein
MPTTTTEKTPGTAGKPAAKRPRKPASKPTPKAPKAKPGAPATAAKPAAGASKWTWPDLPPGATLKLLKSECPRQPGSKAAEHWHSKYRDGMSVEQFRAAGGEVGRLRTDLRRKNLALEPTK